MSAPAARALAAPPDEPAGGSAGEAWPVPALVGAVQAGATGPAPAVAPWRARFAGQLAWNVASEAAARGASLWLSFIAARLLGIEGFGRFVFALTLAQYVWLAGDAVANGGYVAREIARARGGLGSATPGALIGLFARARLAAALALSLLAAPLLLFGPGPPETRRVVAAAMLFFAAYGAHPDWALRGLEDFRGLALANVAGAVALVAATAMLLQRHPDPALAAALWAGSFAVAALVAWPRLFAARAVEAGPGAHAWFGHARRSAVFSAGAVLGIACAQAPMLLVGALATPLQTGLFGASFRLVVAVLGLFSVLWWPLFPVLARTRPEEPAFGDALASVGAGAMLIGLPAAIVFELHARELLTLAFGAPYAASAPALRAVAAILPVFAVAGLLEQVALSTGREAVRARVNGAALLVMVVSAALIVPRWGAAGAGLAPLAGYAVMCAAYARVLRGLLPWRVLGRRAAVLLALNAGLAGAWALARLAGVPVLVSVPLGGLAYACTGLVWLRRAGRRA